MYPPMYCSEYDNTNKVILGPFKLYSKKVNKYTIPRTVAWCFDITICLRVTNWILLVCGVYVNLHIFTCLTFMYFTICSCDKVLRGEWINIAKHVLDGQHVSVTKFFVLRDKNL